MSSIRFTCCLLIAVLMAQHSFAQKGYYKKGFIIAVNGQTIQGEIERLENYTIKKQVRFKPVSGENAILYKAGEIAGFYIEEEKNRFETVEIPGPDSASPKKVFAQLLLRGGISVYKISVSTKERTIIFENGNVQDYIIKKGNSFYLLTETEEQEGTKYTLTKTYIPVLKEIVRDCSSISEAEINHTGFSDKPIVKFFAKYNSCINPSGTVEINKKSTVFQVDHGPDFSYVLLTGNNIHNIGSFSAGWYVNIASKALSRNWSLTTGINILNSRYQYVAEGFSQSYRQTSLRVPLLSRLKLTKQNNSFPVLYVGATPVFNFSTGLEFQASVGAGVVVARKVTAAITYDPYMANKDGYLNFRLGFNIRSVKSSNR